MPQNPPLPLRISGCAPDQYKHVNKPEIFTAEYLQNAK